MIFLQRGLPCRLWPLLAVLSFATTAWPAAADLRGVGIEEDLGAAPQLAPLLKTGPARPLELPLIVRLAASRQELEPSPGEFHLAELSERITLYERLDVGIVLDLGPVPDDTAVADSWKTFVRAVATRCQARVLAFQFGVPETMAIPEAAFFIKTAAVEIRAVGGQSLVIVEGLAARPGEQQADFYRLEMAPYVDALAVGWAEARPPVLTDLMALVDREDPGASIVVGALPLEPSPRDGVRTFLRWEVSHLASPVSLTTYSAIPEVMAGVLTSGANLADVLFGEVVTLDEEAAGLTISRPEDARVAVHRRLLYNMRRFSTYLAYWSETDAAGTLIIDLEEPTGRPPVLRDGVAGTVGKVAKFSWDAETTRASMTVPVSKHPLLLDFNYEGAEVQASRVDVTGRVLPTVNEIIFRHQQVQVAQDAVLYNFTANVTMEQHIRPSMTDPGFDVVTENVFYSDRKGAEWEEVSFSLNGSRWGADRPPFPLVQPEKVLSLPLDLRLNADYSYRFERTETEAGRQCFVLAFKPLDEEKPLYRGSVWIDAATYERVKLRAVQARPGAPVLSNEETHHFASVGSAGGREVHLLERLTSRQIILVAGRNILLEREVRFRGFKINSPDFESRRKVSRQGNNVMFRETDLGLRYLVKKNGERVVDERPASSATAFALGTIIDPSYDYPLPILGINYLDFDFLRDDTQLALLFGGVLALANVQRPQLIGPRVDASLDLFAIAVYGRDQLFETRGELKGAQVEVRPFSTGFNLGFQFTDFQKLAGSYQLQYDAYRATDETSADFVLPTNTFTHGVGLAYEYRRGGYSLEAFGSHYRRTRWEPWGRDGDYDPAHRDYQKYGASISKDFFFGLHKLRLNLAYFGGRDLDRFSMYQFGLFDDTRIHGAPSVGVRFPELAMVRGAYSLDLLGMYRIDVFLDQAVGRDPRGGASWSGLTGLGLGFNLRGPFRTLIRGEIGKSFLPDLYSQAGSFAAQIMFLKPI